MVGDKAFAEEQPAPVEGENAEAAVDASSSEEIDLDAALGSGIRKAPATVETLEEAEVAEGF
jgi:small subunit ribosomal protein S2